MKKIPAVDILGGRCVQLVGGRLGTEKDYGNPVKVAEKWVKEGAEIMHLVDLDATLGRGSNIETVLEIKNSVNALIHLGGGIRTFEKAEEVLSKGIDRIILGTLAVEDHLNETEVVEDIAKASGKNRLIVAIDSSEGFVVYKGWREKTRIRTTDLMNKFENKVWGFLYTNVDVEGRMKGVDIKAIQEVAGATRKPVVISGGISSAADIEAIEEAGAWGVVLGKALYEGKLKL